MLTVNGRLLTSMQSMRNALWFVGSQYDKHGNLVDWWGNQSAQQFYDLAQCFVDEYNQFIVYGHHVCLFLWLTQS